ncbi:hypothetical protein M8994_22875 [Brucella sp. 21LCYQ03]|nr:hypothetical protein [Brucella sp. 21LCYQ03]
MTSPDMSPLKLFRQRLDTLDIAELLSLPEHEVDRLIHDERNQEANEQALLKEEI